MNVVMLVSNGYNPDIRVHKEAKTLTANGHNVTIIAWDRRAEKPEEEDIDNIKVKRIGIRSAYGRIAANILAFPIFWTALFFDLLFQDFDVVHCHDFDTLLPGFLAGKTKRKRIVYDAHESYPAQKATMLPRSATWAIESAEKLLVKRVDSVITVNDILSDMFQHMGGKVSVVMNCQRLEDYELDEKKVEETRKQINPKNRFLMIYIGGLMRGRGLEEMLNALAAIKRETPDKTPALAIYGRGNLADSLKDLAKKNNIDDAVYFGGTINPDEVPTYTKAADLIFILYKPTEMNNRFASPNKLFEAIAAKKPIIATDVGALGQIIRKENIGLLVNNDEKEITSAIRRLMDDAHLYAELADNSRRATEKYNWGNEEKKLLAVYEKLGEKTCAA